MMKLLLKLFPSRFVSDLGDEWLIDTRQEYAQARKQGAWAVAGWLSRTLVGTMKGAAVAHAQESRLALSKAPERRYFLASGGEMVLMQGPAMPSSGIWINTLGAWCGAALAGHMAMGLFLAFWATSLASSIASGFSSLDLLLWVMSLGPVLVKVAGLVLGVALAIKLHPRSNLFGLTWASALSLLLTFGFAASATHITWVLQDLSQRSGVLTEVMSEYPSVEKGLGLPELDSLETATSAQCARATALFSLVESRWIAKARSHAEPLPLILLNGLGAQLWSHGCWTDSQRLAAHQKLEEVSLWAGSAQRRLDIQIPRLREGNQKVVEGLSLSRFQWCVGEIMKLTHDEAPPGKAQQVCTAIPQAQASVHEAGIYSLSAQDLAAFNIPAR